MPLRVKPRTFPAVVSITAFPSDATINGADGPLLASVFAPHPVSIKVAAAAPPAKTAPRTNNVRRPIFD